MAVEEFILYSVAELPSLLIAKVLTRYFGVSTQKAKSLANLIFFALILAACFGAWFFYLYA